jgi:hypothetical protein
MATSRTTKITTKPKTNRDMENTVENKAKFFAQYYGQTIIRNHSGFGGKFKVTDLHFQDDAEYYLELKSLADITDEDAIEVAKLNKSVNWNTGRKEEVFKNPFGDTVVSNGSGLVQKYGQTLVTKISVLTFEQVDLLRSKGYALPFNGLSVEEQISRGWVRIKSKN